MTCLRYQRQALFVKKVVFSEEKSPARGRKNSVAGGRVAVGFKGLGEPDSERA
jgi:hypothetical protein